MQDFNSMLGSAARMPDRPFWLKIGTPCKLPCGLALIVDFDATHIIVATKDGIEASIPLTWVGWQQ